MGHVSRTIAARDDLKEIGRYIAAESGSREIGVRVLSGIKERCLALAEHKTIGEECPEFGIGVRRFTIGSYVLFYRPTANGILLLRVLHGSRDAEREFKERK